jgi:hypothetical protein
MTQQTETYPSEGETGTPTTVYKYPQNVFSDTKTFSNLEKWKLFNSKSLDLPAFQFGNLVPPPQY